MSVVVVVQSTSVKYCEMCTFVATIDGVYNSLLLSSAARRLFLATQSRTLTHLPHAQGGSVAMGQSTWPCDVCSCLECGQPIRGQFRYQPTFCLGGYRYETHF